MRKKYKKYWLAVLIVANFALAGLQANAGTELTLSDAITLAQKQNPALQKARASYEVSSWRPVEALSANLPRLQVNGLHLFDVQYMSLQFPTGKVAMVSPKSLFTLGVYWTVFDGLQGFQNYRAASFLASASALELQKEKLLVVSEVRSAFYRSLALQLLVEVNEENVKALQDHLEKANENLIRGAATKFDKLKIQVQLEEAQAELLQSKDMYALSLGQLAASLGTENSDHNLQGTLPEPVSLSEVQATSLLQESNLDVQVAVNRAHASYAQSAASYGTYLPKLTLYGERQYYNNYTFSLKDPYENAHAIGVQLSWSIFDLGLISRNRQMVNAAEESAASARITKLQGKNEQDTWLRKLRYSQYLFQAKKRAEDLAKEELRLAKIGFAAGTRTTTDVLDAQVDLFRAQAGILHAQIDNIEAKGKLESLLGREL